MFQLRPDAVNACIPYLAQTMHPAGMMIALGDGSVRLLSSSVTPTTWAQACDPQDNANPNLD